MKAAPLGGASAAPRSGGRLGWLDAARVFAALGVVMVHASADPNGNAFNTYPIAQRIGPVMARMFGELSGSELFLVFSLFILAMRVNKPAAEGFGAIMLTQARRLLIPFAVWSIFYLAFRFMKADAFNYSSGLIAEETDWRSWLGYVFMGAAQYHLHFMPMLFMVTMLYPAMKTAIRFPLAGLVVIPLLFCMDTVQGTLWALDPDPTTRDLAGRAIKIICYSGYGFAAFSLFGIWHRGIDKQDGKLLCRFAICMGVIAFLTTLAYGGNVIQTGTWVNRPGASFYAHFLLPIMVFTAFMTAQNIAWAPVFGRLAKLNFGVYLIHPIFIDLYDVGVIKAGLNLEPTVLVATKYLFAVTCAFGAAFLFSKIPPLAWTIGLGGDKPARSRPTVLPIKGLAT